MSESLKQTPEPFTEEEIAAEFTGLQSNVADMAQDESFQEACLEHGLDPFDDSQLEYWQFMRQYANEQLRTMYSNHEIDDLTLQANELAFSAPVFALRWLELNHTQDSSPAERYSAKRDVSYFNAQIRDFARLFPAVKTSTIHSNLAEVIDATVHEDEIVQAGEVGLLNAIRGAKHELAFGQILEQAGIDYRDTTVEEDVRGADYVVYSYDDYPVAVDVKASLSDIEATGTSGVAYRERSDGTLVMYSHVRDTEFVNGGFFVDPDIAKQRAEQVATYFGASAPSLQTA